MRSTIGVDQRGAEHHIAAALPMGRLTGGEAAQPIEKVRFEASSPAWSSG